MGCLKRKRGKKNYPRKINDEIFQQDLPYFAQGEPSAAVTSEHSQTMFEPEKNHIY
jgi:hypothetical protein